MKNSHKPSKTLLQYNFLVPPNEEGLVLWNKVNPPKPSPPIFLYFFHLFIPFFPSLPLSSPPNSQTKPKALFAILEEKRCDDFGRFIFLHNTRSPYNEETKKLYWMRILEGLDNFFKFNLCCYNTLKIKNILIINIHLSFSTNYKITISKKMDDFPIFPFPSPFLQTRKQSLTLIKPEDFYFSSCLNFLSYHFISVEDDSIRV